MNEAKSHQLVFTLQLQKFPQVQIQYPNEKKSERVALNLVLILLS